ncbi:MGMT family protein [Anditalea andensis]|uniref:Cysteine methyltransferase n=1 Tax=Anditalea andensis TaxID=1048983 RepID=A0A074KS59_9BACT|nr:MGMT family protein [Anditalea andensis]KEO72801.1 cysteine methyltransferase [Anditalea andensis]
MKHNKENLYDLIYQIVDQIPKGKVTTYGAIANSLGIKSGARMVGYAMNASHSMSGLPAHRVVNRNGVLTGKHHFDDPDEMQKRLELDGIAVQDDQIVDFKKRFWDPCHIGDM